MRITVASSTPIKRTPRVLQCEGMFDVPPLAKSEREWTVDLPIAERPWNVGLIVGPSGCGKSTVARHLWPEQIAKTYDWPSDSAILDGMPESMAFAEVSEVLSSVGFSSPPSWLRPFHALSNGEQFRVTMARVLAESQDVAVVDEFTSVVDRTVARVASAAIGKSVRRKQKRFVAVTCHDDVEEWLQPDWVLRPAEQIFAWRSLRRRPEIRLEIRRVHHRAWALFHRHHYMSADLAKSAACFVAFWEGRPVAFDAWLPFVGKLKGKETARRGHRTVCLPDYQGVGIGGILFTTVASAWRALGHRVFSRTAHPAEIAQRMRSQLWRMTRHGASTPNSTATATATATAMRSLDWMRQTRIAASFEYVGEPMALPNARRLLADVHA